MALSVFAARLLEQEVAGLIGRLQQVRPFALHETMVPAALPSHRALRDIDLHLESGRRSLIALARRFVRWLAGGRARRHSAAAVYRLYVFLRLRVNLELTKFDLFADAITQRSEAGTGVLLAGLDALAHDALHMPHTALSAPPLLCYLDRGIGAAIRRARTRLPGGGENPVAIIRVPRERMVGLGIASSLVHEAGHQGAALLDLVPLLRRAMEPNLSAARARSPWQCWYRWISEIVADLWSVSRLGVTSTLGLMSVVSLPRVFVFRANLDDPHPTPWVRVLISAEIGRQLYPHAQWDRLLDLWLTSYPLPRSGPQAATVRALAAHVPDFVGWLLRQHAGVPAQPIGRLLADPELDARRLDEHVEQWFRRPGHLHRLRPCQAFAVAGYCKLVRASLPVPEIELFSSLLTRWAQAERTS